MIRVIVFDFDGVIVRDSEFFKQEAWAAIFSIYDGKATEYFHEAEAKYGGGRDGDRYEILRHIFARLAEPGDRIPSLVKAGAAAFNAYVERKILEVGVEPSDRRVLEDLSKRYPLYINSATPEKELKQTVARLKLDCIFKGVFGYPSKKVENLKLVQQSENVKPQSILFVGDGERDYEAAREFDCHFMGYANDWNKWAGSEKQFALITNLRNVTTGVETILQ